MQNNDENKGKVMTIEERLVELEAIVVFLIRDYDKKHGEVTEGGQEGEAVRTESVEDQDYEMLKIENRLEALCWVVSRLYHEMLQKQGRIVHKEGKAKGKDKGKTKRKLKGKTAEDYMQEMKKMPNEEFLTRLEGIVFMLCEQRIEEKCMRRFAIDAEENEACECLHWCPLVKIVDSYLYSTRREMMSKLSLVITLSCGQ